MFKYSECLLACNRLGLNPLERGSSNIFADSKDASNFPDPFDLDSIAFPAEYMSEILGIGTLISNLISQKKFPEHFNLTTEKGKQEKVKNVAIARILPTLMHSQNAWLQKGMKSLDKKITQDLKLNFHNGILYQRDPVAFAGLRNIGPRPNMRGLRSRPGRDNNKKIFR